MWIIYIKRLMNPIKVCDLIQDDICQQAFGSDGGAIIEGFAAELVRVVAEDFALAGGGSNLGFNAKQHWNVLVGMKTVGDEKGDDDHIRSRSHLMPVGDEG